MLEPLHISLTLRNGLLVVPPPEFDCSILTAPFRAVCPNPRAIALLTSSARPRSKRICFLSIRKVILTSCKWSPVSGLMIVGLGTLGYWEATRATNGVDYVSRKVH